MVPRLDISKLTVGMKVGYVSGGFRAKTTIVDITRLTKSRIMIELPNYCGQMFERSFNADGSKEIGGVTSSWLCPLSYAEEMIGDQTTRSGRRAAFKAFEDASAAILKNHRDGYGDYGSDPTAAELAALTAAVAMFSPAPARVDFPPDSYLFTVPEKSS